MSNSNMWVEGLACQDTEVHTKEVSVWIKQFFLFLITGIHKFVVNSEIHYCRVSFYGPKQENLLTIWLSLCFVGSSTSFKLSVEAQLIECFPNMQEIWLLWQLGSDWSKLVRQVMSAPLPNALWQVVGCIQMFYVTVDVAH